MTDRRMQEMKHWIKELIDDCEDEYCVGVIFGLLDRYMKDRIDKGACA